MAASVLEALGGDPDTHLFDALRRAAPEAVAHIRDPAAGYPLAAIGLMSAWAAGDDARTMARLEALEINFDPPLVKLIVLVLCAELIELSAQHHAIAREEEVLRWREWLSTLPVSPEQPRIQYRRPGRSAPRGPSSGFPRVEAAGEPEPA